MSEKLFFFFRKSCLWFKKELFGYQNLRCYYVCMLDRAYTKCFFISQINILDITFRISFRTSEKLFRFVMTRRLKWILSLSENNPRVCNFNATFTTSSRDITVCRYQINLLYCTHLWEMWLLLKGASMFILNHSVLPVWKQVLHVDKKMWSAKL